MGGVQTCPGAINDSGRIVAAVRMADGTHRLILWDKSGQTEELASFPPGSSVPTMAINNAGEVACTVGNDPNRNWHSFFWDVDRRRYALNDPGVAYVEIHAMNNHGQVVGCRDWPLPRNPAHAFLWDKAAGMQDLGLFNNGESGARPQRPGPDRRLLRCGQSRRADFCLRPQSGSAGTWSLEWRNVCPMLH